MPTRPLKPDTLALLRYLSSVAPSHLERDEIAEGMEWGIGRVNAAVDDATAHELDKSTSEEDDGPVGTTTRGREVAAQGHR